MRRGGGAGESIAGCVAVSAVRKCLGARNGWGEGKIRSNAHELLSNALI